MSVPKPSARLCLACLALLAGRPVAAQALEFAPITIDLPPGRMAGTIKITNRGDEPTTVQVRPYAWSQPDGREQLDPTADLIASPPFATIGPGDDQTVRVVLRRPATVHEDSYRLLVDQLPPAAMPGSVRVALRVSLPVFAGASGAAVPRLTWTVLPAATGGGGMLVVRNDGIRHARISDLKLTAGKAAIPAPGFTFRYVLPGAAVSIPLDLPSSVHGIVHVSAASDQGRIEADAPITPRP